MSPRASAAGAAGVASGAAAAKPKRATKAKAAPITAEALRALAAKADEAREASDFEARTAALGVAIKFSTGTYAATGHGVRASSTEGPRGALRNWANAARREAGRR